MSIKKQLKNFVIWALVILAMIIMGGQVLFTSPLPSINNPVRLYYEAQPLIQKDTQAHEYALDSLPPGIQELKPIKVESWRNGLWLVISGGGAMSGQRGYVVVNEAFDMRSSNQLNFKELMPGQLYEFRWRE